GRWALGLLQVRRSDRHAGERSASRTITAWMVGLSPGDSPIASIHRSAPVAASAPPSRAKKLQLWGAKKLQSEQLARAKSSIEMAGATRLKPATFGVTGRTKFNEINAGCNIFFA